MGGGPVHDGEGEQRAGRDGAAGALEGDRAGGGAGEGLRGDAGSGRLSAEATDVTGAGVLGEGDDEGGVWTAAELEVDLIVDGGGHQSGRSGGEVGGRAGEVDVVGGCVGDGRGVHPVPTRRSADLLEGDRAGGGAGEGLRGDAGSGRLSAEAADVTGAGVLGEGDDE